MEQASRHFVKHTRSLGIEDGEKDLEDLNIVDIRLKGVNKKVLLDEKTFSTGSKGFNGVGKLETPDGKKYQLNFLAIEIGLKPKTPKHRS